MSAKRDIELHNLPAHLFRRLHQLAVARFTSRMENFGLTPIQWAALAITYQRPGLDQSTLSREIYIDTSTVADVVDRLETRGLIKRRPSPDDRRLRLLYLTERGRSLLGDATVDVLEIQQWLLAPLSAKEQAQFMALMLKVLNRRD